MMATFWALRWVRAFLGYQVLDETCGDASVNVEMFTYTFQEQFTADEKARVDALLRRLDEAASEEERAAVRAEGIAFLRERGSNRQPPSVEDRPPMPDFVGAPLSFAERVLNGLGVDFTTAGDGGRVIATDPAAGADICHRDRAVVLTLGERP